MKIKSDENIKKKWNNYAFPSINHVTYLQNVTKISLSPFDEKPNYLNDLESIPVE